MSSLLLAYEETPLRVVVGVGVGVGGVGDGVGNCMNIVLRELSVSLHFDSISSRQMRGGGDELTHETMRGGGMN